MLRPRIIPVLLVHNGGLVKTVRSDNPEYVGDPINAVRIFNEKEVDELVVADIDATVQNRDPDYTMIRNLAAECRMPICYSGGVQTPEQVERFISLGVEKVAVSSAAISNPSVISESAIRVGNQSIVVVMDVKRTGLLRRYEICTHNGRRQTGLDPVEFARKVETLGAGEIVVNSIENDGAMNGIAYGLHRESAEGVVRRPYTAKTAVHRGSFKRRMTGSRHLLWSRGRRSWWRGMGKRRKGVDGLIVEGTSIN